MAWRLGPKGYIPCAAAFPRRSSISDRDIAASIAEAPSVARPLHNFVNILSSRLSGIDPLLNEHEQRDFEKYF
jgi:hypothetical protein